MLTMVSNNPGMVIRLLKFDHRESRFRACKGQGVSCSASHMDLESVSLYGVCMGLNEHNFRAPIN